MKLSILVIWFIDRMIYLGFDYYRGIFCLHQIITYLVKV
ncbi:unnamed protein product [Schistosoma curassoni]|uniref:Uncharacterized protein n=1 Tax=Schistosoma curassoni TaxID=6186 RepID=A0A183KMY0_9TREM|nr:unnamed protein product [Schistosoma curassoni]